MKKKFRLLTILACVFAFCMTAFIAVNVNEAKAAGESYTLSFKSNERESITKSMSGWWSNVSGGGAAGITQSGDTITVDFSSAGGTVYCNQTTVKDKVYGIKIEYKTAEAGKTSEFHLFNTYAAWKAIKTNIPVTDEWQTYEGTFTATTDTDRVTLQVNNANYTSIPLQFRNIVINDITTQTVTAGSAIGTLPEVPAKDGYDGYWTIDGEKITAETVYNYGTNKTAVPVYEKNNRFTVAFQAKGSDMAASAESWNRYKMPTFENGVATLPRAEGDTGAINYAAGVDKYNVEAGKTYKLELKLKADNIYIRFSTERPDYNAVFIDGWTNNADYVAYSFDYTATATGPVDFIFQLTAGTGNVCIKDFYFYENVTKEVEGGTAIGELPVIPEVAGYANGRWEIDGEKITAETVYDYGENKTAVLVYDRLYNLEFRSENYKIVGGEWVYNQPQVTEAGEYLMTRDPELETGKQVNYATGCKFKTEADKTYVLNLSVKCDNTFINLGFETFDGTDTPKYNYFYTKWTENVDYVDYVIECKTNVSGESWILFTLSGGGGEIYVKNMSLYEKVASKNLLDGAAVGELPALNDIPVKHGFEYCWTIDGAKITAETVFNYGKNKVAAPSMLAIEGDHTLTKVEAVDSTCTENGVKEYYVCACGKNFADENGYNEIADLDAWKAGDGKIAAKGHTAVKVDGKAATCEEEGFKDYYNCLVCGKNFTDETCATEIADLDAWKAGDGKIAAKGHTAVKVDGKAATCKEAGFKDYYNCSVCGKNFTDETCATEIADLEAWKAGDGKIAAKGHVAATEWNSDENGHWHNCETCGAKMDETAGVHADENGDGKCDVCGYDMGKEPSGSESKETPTESSSGSGKKSSDGGCFSGINGVVGLTTLAILAAAAVIFVKRKEN